MPNIMPNCTEGDANIMPCCASSQLFLKCANTNIIVTRLLSGNEQGYREILAFGRIIVMTLACVCVPWETQPA